MSGRRMTNMTWQPRSAMFSMIAVLVMVLAMASAAARASSAELVMFFEAGCPWCARWDREVGEAYERTDEGRIAPLRRVDISDARRSGIRLASAVTVTPTFVLVEDGGEVGRITGYPGADFFWGMLGELIARLPAATTRQPPERNMVPGRQTCLSMVPCGGKMRVARLPQGPA